MGERPFSAAIVFCLLWLALAYICNVVILPEWNTLNIALCSIAVALSGMNYVNEYLGKFPLSYSKFAPEGQMNPRLGWALCYGLPAVVQIALWYSAGMPQSTYQLVAMGTYVVHFLKRVLEALFVHKYSKKWSFFSALQVSLFYTLGSAVQHYWCNVYTDEDLAAKLSSDDLALIVGFVLYLIGEFLNGYHHYELACLRPAAGSATYSVPESALFRFVVCPHYCFELVAWFGMAVVCQHFGIYLGWMVMVTYLAGRSHQTQQWYQKKIDNFPTDRRNMFPGIY
ncbi:Very-long-chain enoyl-CoA reductase [Acropora cervicornis]|uniref:Very-long-chain enoyl-CoA reductase n=1 Tax=Acropora cervicornis TaxID=6130 RepID=A0AAD9UTU9_ACRCE|nr:Very-long-chain enoyl-CoA reductase [Acropora cervicornis]